MSTLLPSNVTFGDLYMNIYPKICIIRITWKEYNTNQ